MTIAQAMEQAAQHHAARRLDEAETIYRAILAQMPRHGYATHYLGLIMIERGQKQQGLQFLRESVLADPGMAQFHSNLSGALLETGDAAGAERAAREAIRLDPDLAQTRVNLGQALWQLSRVEEALEEMRTAARLMPDNPDAQSHLGLFLMSLGREKEALTPLQRALSLEPQAPSHYVNLGNAMLAARRAQAAISFYRTALERLPNEPMVHFNLALALLTAGEWAEGFREYEWRLRISSLQPIARNYPQPHWDGSPLNGRTIFVYPEPLLGDAIMYARYVQMILAAGGKVVLECQPESLELFQGLTGSGQLIARGEALPAFDIYCSLLSLPKFFNTTTTNVPAYVPYISVAGPRVERWKNQIDAESAGSKLKVGVVWAGGIDESTVRQQSILLEAFAPLAIEGVSLFGLQVGPAAAQAHLSPGGMKITDLGGRFESFADVAAAIANLDLVISVDSSVAHIAGAMDKPVWVVVPYLPYWVWGLEGSTTPWYPSATLFRQPTPNDWGAVITQMRDALRERINAS